MKPLLALALPLVLAAGAAMAGGSFSGKYPLTVTHAKYGNGAYCLTLNDDGGFGWPHSGEASLVTPSGSTVPYGTFQLIGSTLVTTMEEQGGEGQNAGAVFSASTKNGKPGNGFYDQVYGGQALDTGKVAFSAKGGC